MDLYSFNLTTFKKVFYAILAINIVMTLATYILGSNVLGMIMIRHNVIKETRIFLLLLIVAAVFQTSYQKKLLKKLDEIGDFEEKMAHYLRIYKLRLYWKCSSCFTSCLIHILTGRNIFLYFAVFDVLTTWTYFPNKILIRKELKSEDVAFLED